MIPDCWSIAGAHISANTFRRAMVYGTFESSRRDGSNGIANEAIRAVRGDVTCVGVVRVVPDTRVVSCSECEDRRAQVKMAFESSRRGESSHATRKRVALIGSGGRVVCVS